MSIKFITKFSGMEIFMSLFEEQTANSINSAIVLDFTFVWDVKYVCNLCSKFLRLLNDYCTLTVTSRKSELVSNGDIVSNNTGTTVILWDLMILIRVKVAISICCALYLNVTWVLDNFSFSYFEKIMVSWQPPPPFLLNADEVMRCYSI